MDSVTAGDLPVNMAACLGSFSSASYAGLQPAKPQSKHNLELTVSLNLPASCMSLLQKAMSISLPPTLKLQRHFLHLTHCFHPFVSGQRKNYISVA